MRIGIVGAAAAKPPAAAVVQSDTNMISIDTTIDGTSLTIPKPAGTVEGDLLVAQIGSAGNAITDLAGWTLINTASNFAVSKLYWRNAGASEPANYTWTIGASSGNADAASGGIIRIDGHDPADPVDLVNSRIGDSTTPQTFGGTASTEFALRLRFAIMLNGAATDGNIWGGFTSSGHAAIACQKDAATTSAVGEYTFSASIESDPWTGQLLVINPLNS